MSRTEGRRGCGAFPPLRHCMAPKALCNLLLYGTFLGVARTIFLRQATEIPRYGCAHPACNHAMGRCHAISEGYVHVAPQHVAALLVYWRPEWNDAVGRGTSNFQSGHFKLPVWALQTSSRGTSNFQSGHFKLPASNFLLPYGMMIRN